MISKINNDSYHDGTSAFFNDFSEKDLQVNAVEYKIKNMSNYIRGVFRTNSNIPDGALCENKLQV